jgi:hypothetical protein
MAVFSTSAVWPELGPALDAICVKAPAKKPADRFARMAELAQTLERAADRLGLFGPRPDLLPVPPPKGSPPTKEPDVLRLACLACGQKLRADGVPGKAVWYRVRDVAPHQIRRVITFGELSRSPVEEEGASRPRLALVG